MPVEINANATVYERMTDAAKLKFSMYLPPRLKSQVTLIKAASNARIDKEVQTRESVEKLKKKAQMDLERLL